MSTWGKFVGAASITTGLVGAAALGGVTAQRRAVRRLRGPAAGDSPGYDALIADRTYSVVADDGVVLHVEEIGPHDAELTVIFGHGWTLRSGAWHFQRTGLAGKGFGAGGDGQAARLVFFDQRSHGKSTRAGTANVSMEDLAADLAAVLATAAPHGSVVLVGHSMGGMALITLAGLRPDLFAERIVGVGLVSTAARASAGEPIAAGVLSSSRLVLRLAGVAAARYPGLIERGRAGTRDAVWLLTRTLGFAQKNVSGELVDYLDEMISATPVDVIVDFMPALLTLDRSTALPALDRIPVVIICGDADRQTPLVRSLAIARALPNAEMVVIEKAGHMAILERPDVVNEALRRLFVRAAQFARSTPRKSG
ncbi:MAG: alpha/beta fold hydrolase [Nakamurella sp.]